MIRNNYLGRPIVFLNGEREVSRVQAGSKISKIFKKAFFFCKSDENL